MTAKHLFIVLSVTLLLIGCGNSTTEAPVKPPTAVMMGDRDERIDLHFYPSIQESEKNCSKYFFEESSNDEIKIRQGVRIFSDDNSKIEKITGILNAYSESLEREKVKKYIIVYLLRHDNCISTLSIKVSGKIWYASIYTNSPS